MQVDLHVDLVRLEDRGGGNSKTCDLVARNLSHDLLLEKLLLLVPTIFELNLKVVNLN
jgi:hypothetical protein